MQRALLLGNYYYIQLSPLHSHKAEVVGPAPVARRDLIGLCRGSDVVVAGVLRASFIAA